MQNSQKLESFELKVTTDHEQEKKMLYTFTLAAYNSKEQYTQYTMDMIDDAFHQCNVIFILYKNNIPAGYALIQKKDDIKNILLMFTLPTGQKQMLVTRLLGTILDYYHYENLILITHGFSWLIGPAISHGLLKNENQEYSTSQQQQVENQATKTYDDITSVWYDLTTDYGNEIGLRILQKALNQKDTSYTYDQIVNAFSKATQIMIVYHNYEQYSFAFIMHDNQKAIVLLLFTFVQGQMLISRMLTLLKEHYSSNQKMNMIQVKTYKFSWIIGPCIANGFIGPDELKSMHILHFNNIPFFTYNKLNSLLELRNQIEHEPCHEHLPIPKNFETMDCLGPLAKNFLTWCKPLLTNDEWTRTRFDLRVAMIREGQSLNPLGIHTDFIQKDKQGFFTNPKEYAKVILLSIGQPGTKIIINPISIACNVKNWTELWRDILYKDKMTHAKSFILQDAEPILMTNYQLHTARVLETNNPGLRMMMRLIVFPFEQISEVPTYGTKSIQQVYIGSQRM